MGAVWVKKKDLDKFCQCLSVLTRITNCIKKMHYLLITPLGVHVPLLEIYLYVTRQNNHVKSRKKE